MKGRHIEDPIRFIADLFDFTERKLDHSYILFAADFQKAFDSIEHNFILAVLQHYGFGEEFVKWIKILTLNSKSCILNNGTASDFVNIKRGTKQGDPISPFLFILTIEILAVLIRSNNKIKGINLGNEAGQTKLTLFADDATFCLLDVESVKEVLRILDSFKQFSSLQLNMKKSEIGWVGKKGQPLNELDSFKMIDFQSDGVKILGIFFSHNKTLMQNNNFTRTFENFKSVLSVWKMRNLSMYGKSQVVRSLAISQLLYVCSNLSIPNNFTVKVQKEIVKFIWNARKPKIKYKTLIGNFEEGGIRLPDLEIMIQTNRVKWAFKRLKSENCNFWKTFANAIFIREFGSYVILGENFNSLVIEQKNIPMFYKEILRSWDKFSTKTITTPEEILRQPIWLNKQIRLDIEHFNIREYIKQKMIRIEDVWDTRDRGTKMGKCESKRELG